MPGGVSRISEIAIPAVVAGMLLLSWPLPVAAQSSPQPPQSQSQGTPAAPQADGQGAQTVAPLSPGGVLQAYQAWVHKLADDGFKFSLREDSEIWAKLAGPGNQTFSYVGLTTAKLDVDLDKWVGWKGGEFLVSAYDVHGHGPSRSFAGNLQLISDLEGAPSIKLYDLWLDQTWLDGKLSVRAGQEGANDELMMTTYGGVLFNSSFGFPGVAAADLPSGGPNYPLATPFARVRLKPDDHFTVYGAVFNGDPAPPGTGDPQIRDRNGTAFRLDDHTLGLVELWYSPDTNGPANLPTTYKVGGWYSSDNFADRRFDNSGGLLASPESTGTPLNHVGDWAFYGIVDQRVWQPADSKDRGIGVFFQVMGAPDDRNLTNLFVEGGMNWRGPFEKRADDVFGLGVSYLGVSSSARQFSRDLVALGRATSAYASNETVIEATYQAPISDWFTLQPDLQFVVNPNAGMPNNFGKGPLPTTAVLGLRFSIQL